MMHDARPSTSASKFTIQNRCSYAVNPIIANTNCGYSPREFFRYPVVETGERGSPPSLSIALFSHGLRGLTLAFISVRFVFSRLQYTWVRWGPEPGDLVHRSPTGKYSIRRVQERHDQQPVER